MTRCVIDAIVQSGVYAILSKGWSDRLQVKSAGEVAEPEVPLPKEIFPISSIPHDWLFKRVDAACHHGGAGTTGASVRGKSLFLRVVMHALTVLHSRYTHHHQTLLRRSALLGRPCRSVRYRIGRSEVDSAESFRRFGSRYYRPETDSTRCPSWRTSASGGSFRTFSRG